MSRNRPDAEIAHQAREILAEVLPRGPTGVEAAVHNGVVTLAGEAELAADKDLMFVDNTGIPTEAQGWTGQ